jgi:hypothetical protein
MGFYISIFLGFQCWGEVFSPQPLSQVISRDKYKAGDEKHCELWWI